MELHNQATALSEFVAVIVRSVLSKGVHRFGGSSLEIASVTGHSSSDVRSILDSAYLSRTKMLGDNAIRKLERRTKPRI
jgi:hypothetical protein